jgi:DNA-binding transcriptional MerR regulator
MFSIGDFAAIGRVSVRMLRHYDAVGVLRPASVDPGSGYRYYHADQFRRLNRVIALKDLGFTLQQVRAILDDEVSVEELRGMLRMRRAQLEAQLSADAVRLASVEARLRMISTEGRMTTDDVILKPVPPVRVAELSGIAASYGPEDISPVIQPLYVEVFRRLGAAGICPSGPSVAYYEKADESGEAVVVHAAVPVPAPPRADHGLTVVQLPPIGSAATIVHRGAMDDAGGSFQTLARWIDDHGFRMDGYAREVCLEFDPDDPDAWVHELQVAVVRG